MFGALFAAIGYAVSGIFGAFAGMLTPTAPIQTSFINQPDDGGRHSYYEEGFQTNEEPSGFGRKSVPERVVLGEVGTPIILADVSKRPSNKPEAKKPEAEEANGQITLLSGEN